MPDRPLRVALEVGKRWVFASALDWPGWCRRGKGEEAALDLLLEYAPRYAPVAGAGFDPGAVGEPEIVGRVAGNMITDFGAPAVPGPWDREPLAAAEAARQADLLAACWTRFDGCVAVAPAVLRKGPRGGGRDRDAIVDHVREAERGYAPKLGVRIRPGTQWEEQRQALLAAVLAAEPHPGWPLRYAIRRIAWHVLDHAWEIEDRGD